MASSLRIPFLFSIIPGAVVYLLRLLIVETQNFFTLLVALITVPFFGWLTKKISPRILLLIICFGFITLSYFMNVEMLRHVMQTQFYLAHFSLVLLASAYLAVFVGFISSLFPTELRYSGIAVSYNVSLALFGGTAPLVVTTLIAHTIFPAPGILLTIGGCIAFIALLFSKRLAKY